MPLLLLALLFLLTEVAIAQRPSDSFDNAVFNAPKGWRRVESGGTLIFIPQDLRSGERVLIALLPSEVLSSNFRDWFKAKIRQSLQDGERIVKESDLLEQRVEEGYDTLVKLIETRDSAGYSYHRLYLGARPGNRAEMVLYLASSAELFKRYGDTFQGFALSLDYKSARSSDISKEATSTLTSPPKINKPTGGLSGLYTGNKYRLNYNTLTNTYEHKNVNIHYIFSPDGRVYQGLPKGGTLENFDMDLATRLEPKKVGRYEISGNKITLSWPDSAGSPSDYKPTSWGMKIGDTPFYRVKPWNGLKLDGTYSVKSFVNTSSRISGEGGIAGENVLIFRRDGTFESSGFTGYAASTSNVNTAATVKRSGRGSYKITGNTLELKFNDGTTLRSTFYVHPQNESEPRPGLIVIDGTYYLLRD